MAFSECFYSIVMTTLPVKVPAPFKLFSSRNCTASRAAAKGNVWPTIGFKTPSSIQRTMSSAQWRLLVGEMR